MCTKHVHDKELVNGDRRVGRGKTLDLSQAPVAWLATEHAHI